MKLLSTPANPTFVSFVSMPFQSLSCSKDSRSPNTHHGNYSISELEGPHSICSLMPTVLSISPAGYNWMWELSKFLLLCSLLPHQLRWSMKTTSSFISSPLAVISLQTHQLISVQLVLLNVSAGPHGLLWPLYASVTSPIKWGWC